jgi:formylglycine-generating enzyme required for sulfatase activity
LKIPALVLVVGFVVYLLWRGITSLPINSDPSLTETRSAQMQTAVQETIAVQWTSMSAAGTIAAQETSTRVAEMIVTKSAAETMVVIQTESARPIETTVPTLTLVIGSTMTSDKDNMTSLYVPKGEFTMGNGDSNAPIHNVYLDAFYIDQFEVTNEMYAKCVADNGTCAEPSDTNHFSNASYANHPVVYVDWEMAKTYCNWAGGDLPTEAQWEKAASWDEASQTQRVYPWGDSIDCNHANYQSGCVGDTSPVGSYDSGKSPYGAYEMAGNVWEWVNDYYQSDYYADNASNPQGPTSSEYRVLRGGSWLNFNFDARSAIRLRYTPDNSSDFIGFRCARSLP